MILLYPLLRGAKAAENIRAGEAAVYRDQLREIERDLNSGLIMRRRLIRRRAEIGRRLIAVCADDRAETPKPADGMTVSPRPSFSWSCRFSGAVYI